MSEYQFQIYDVLQSHNGPANRPWLDFATIKDTEDAFLAKRLVELGMWEGKPLEFRIVRHVPCVGSKAVYGRAD